MTLTRHVATAVIFGVALIVGVSPNGQEIAAPVEALAEEPSAVHQSDAVQPTSDVDCYHSCYDCQKTCESKSAGSARSDCMRSCTAIAAGCCAGYGKKPPSYTGCNCQ
jgi:hypothetical protein